MSKTYKNFDLVIRGNRAKGYTVEARVEGGGEVHPRPLELPQDKPFELRMKGILGGTTNTKNMRAVGNALFDALFPNEIALLWSGARPKPGDDKGLRVRLDIEPPELIDLPWELVCKEDDYIGLHPDFQIVRYLGVSDPPRSVVSRKPLRVLVVVSQPRDKPPVDVDTELADIYKVVTQPSDMLEMYLIASTSCEELQNTLERGFHVLHYIGHGEFKSGEGHLILVDADGRSDWVSASLLRQIMVNSSLRLVVLNACHTSATGSESAFSGVAQQLVRGGMPAVVAMQLPINNECAAAFSRQFYRALVKHWQVDTAVQEGRRGIVTVLRNAWNACVDWAVPVLYMRAPDGVILEIQEEEVDAGETPEHLVHTLKEIVEYNQELQERKQLHHHLHTHLDRLRIFMSRLEDVVYYSEPWPKRTAKGLWQDYRVQLDLLKTFAASAKSICHVPFFEDKDGLRGEDWIVEIVGKARPIEGLLDGHDVRSLHELTRRLYETCNKHLIDADEKLKDAAREMNALLSVVTRSVSS